MKLQLAALAAACLMSSTAHSAAVFLFQEVGGNVVGTLSGSLNVGALAPTTGFGHGGTGVVPNAGLLGSGVAGAPETGYLDQLFGPAGWGSGGVTIATSFSGNTLYIDAVGSDLFLDASYLSGAALAGTLTFAVASFATLGVTPGSFVYSLAASRTAPVVDTFTIEFRVAAVPEPGAAGLALVALIAAGAASRRGRRQA